MDGSFNQDATKRCTVCGTTKPRGDFYSLGGWPKSKGYVMAKCKSCHSKDVHRRNWKGKHPREAVRHTREYQKRNKGKVAARVAFRDASKIRRTPVWADLNLIEAFYVEARRLTQETGIEHQVDHVIPLLGKSVSGLHVESNLQVITKAQNMAKRNSFYIT